MRENISSDIKAVLTGFNDNEHVLHLYSSNVDKYAIQTPFLLSTQKDKDEGAFYITGEEHNSILDELERLNIDISVIHPKNMRKFDINKKMRIIFDAGSIGADDNLQSEKYLSKINNGSILCTYDISKLNPEIIKRLAKCHDRLIITTDDVTVLSAESIGKSNIGNESIERFVKNYLDMIVLALILEKPMCGIDVIKEIHRNFNVMLSPGTVYPLLHALEEKGLLECEYNIKKRYTVLRTEKRQRYVTCSRSTFKQASF